MTLNVAAIIVLTSFLLPALPKSLGPAILFVIIGEEGDLFEGDIKFGLNYDRNKRFVLQNLPIAIAKQPALNPSIYSGTLWPNGTVYFKFDENISFENSQTFLTAIGIWEQHTCLKFQQGDENTTAYLLLTDTDGCSSYIGRVRIIQEVSISLSCQDVGHAIHELGHAIGLWHEHTRLDC
uniref:Metalloendopeptidase n=1 Tax=Amphimedon queenslandica TaxID=400682 RepID=A0A1X7TPP3_AMPQE